MIARTWRGWVRTEDRDDYVAYIRDTGIAQYRATPGNLEAHVLTRDLDDGRTEVVTLSFWTSLDAVRGFAGDDDERAVVEDAARLALSHWDDRVTHHEVVVDVPAG